MDVRDLAWFVAVAREGTVTAAAATLPVSQPALSRRLRALEDELGAALFVRDPGGMTPTAVGAALLPHAERVLDAAAAARAAVEEAKAATATRLTVGMSTGLGRGLLPAVRTRVTAARPDADLAVRQVPWSDPTGGLDAGDTDVAFLWSPVPDHLARVTVVVEPRHVAMPADHRLADHERIGFTALVDEPFLALPRSAGPLRAFWLAEDARGGGPVRVGAEVASLDETHEALLDGRGVVLLAAGNAPLLARAGVVTRPVDGLGPCELVVAWRHADDRPLLRAYVAACRAVAQALPAGATAPERAATPTPPRAHDGAP